MTDASITLLILCFTIFMFVTEKLPLGVTAMLSAVSLVFFGVLSPQEAFDQLANKNIVLIVSMLIIGAALFETGMADRIGNMVKKVARTENQLIAATMILCGVMSAFLSNTGTAVVLIPVIVGMSIGLKYCSKTLLMPIAISCSIGGIISLVGQPANLLGNGHIQTFGHEPFSFFSFGTVGVPMLLIAVAYYILIGKRFLSPQEHQGAEKTETQSNDYQNVPAWKQYLSLATLVTAVIGMVLGKGVTGFDLHVIASIGAISLIITGVLNEKQAYKAIDLGVVFLLAGMLAMAVALGKSGAGAMIAENLVGLLGESPSGYGLMVTMLLLATVMTNIMSNTATGALLIPIAYSLAVQIGVNPVGIVFAVIIGTSQCFCMVMGQPANPLAMSASKRHDGSGGLSFTDFVKVGTPLAAINTVLAIMVIPMVFPM